MDASYILLPRSWVVTKCLCVSADCGLSLRIAVSGKQPVPHFGERIKKNGLDYQASDI